MKIRSNRWWSWWDLHPRPLDCQSEGFCS